MTSQAAPHEITAAAHRGLSHANPLSIGHMKRLVDMAAARRPFTALEIGCGPGSFAVALAERVPVNVTALETNPLFLARVGEIVAAKHLRGSVRFLETDAAHYRGDSVDLAVCIGASQAFGTPREALARLATMIRLGGTLIFAELMWAAEPPAEFLEFMGATPDSYWNMKEAAYEFAAVGLSITAELRASAESWRRYEDAVRRGRLALAATLPREQGQSLRDRAEAWHRAYLRYGRHCLGFAAYVAQHP